MIEALLLGAAIVVVLVVAINLIERAIKRRR
jgi:hypothetical protein